MASERDLASAPSNQHAAWILGGIFETELDVRDALDLAGIDPRPVAFSGSVVQMWSSALASIRTEPHRGEDVVELVSRREPTMVHAVRAALSRYFTSPPETLGDARGGPTAVSLAALPWRKGSFFGREADLALLDAAWASPTRVVAVVGWGGQGKSALVRHWLTRMASEGYRGAERVYGWSFHSQGTAAGRPAAGGAFMDHALRSWFGEDIPADTPPNARGELLASLIRRSRTLLVLDGLEPLQHGPGELVGQVSDPAVRSLLLELCASQPGLCIVTSRLSLTELEAYTGSGFSPLPLSGLSDTAGAQLLGKMGASGDQDELESASRELHGHPLALALLGSYAEEALDGDIARRSEIPSLLDAPDGADQARAILASWAGRLGPGPELSLLHLLGLFDRPVETDVMDALMRPPAIAPLTDTLMPLPRRRWNRALKRLREVGLVAEKGSASDALDCHPLVREYFGADLASAAPGAWREAHSRLFDHFARAAPEQPTDAPSMELLFRACMHGCLAERRHDVLTSVLRPRVMRNDEQYAVRALGAINSVLAILSCYFHDHEWHRPMVGDEAKRAGLDDEDQLVYLTDTATLLVMIKGYGFGALRVINEEIRHITERTGGAIHEFQALRALSVFHCVQAEFTEALELARRMTALATSESADTFMRLEARFATGLPLFYLGRVSECEAEMREGFQLYDSGLHAGRRSHGHDPGVGCRLFQSWAAVMLGKPDSALALVLEATADARRLQDPYSIVCALTFCAFIHRLRREPDAVREAVREASGPARKKHYSFWIAKCDMYDAWADALVGRDDAILRMQRALAAFSATGARFGITHARYMLIEALRATGRPEEALRAASEGLMDCGRNGELVYEAEFLRLRSEIALESTDMTIAPGIDPVRDLTLASERARDRQQAWFELRALRALGAVDPPAFDARSALENVLGRVDGGGDLPDVRDARGVLAGLCNR